LFSLTPEMVYRVRILSSPLFVFFIVKASPVGSRLILFLLVRKINSPFTFFLFIRVRPVRIPPTQHTFLRLPSFVSKGAPPHLVIACRNHPPRAPRSLPLSRGG